MKILPTNLVFSLLALVSGANASTLTYEAAVTADVLVWYDSGGVTGVFTFPQFNPTNGFLDSIQMELRINDHFGVYEVNPYNVPMGFTTSFPLSSELSMGTTTLLHVTETVGGGSVVIPANSHYIYQADYQRTNVCCPILNAFFREQFIGVGSATNRLVQLWSNTQSYGMTSANSVLGLTVNYTYSPPQTINLTIRASQVEVCFQTSANRVYQLQANSSLDPGSWTNVEGEVIGDGTRKCLTQSVLEGQPGCYYRVITLR